MEGKGASESCYLTRQGKFVWRKKRKSHFKEVKFVPGYTPTLCDMRQVIFLSGSVLVFSSLKLGMDDII